MSKPLFQVEDSGGRTVTIRNVPVFRTHNDRDYRCDEEWLDRCVADFLAQKAESATVAGDRYAMLPPITIGHTPDDPNHPEPPAKGFVDNLCRFGEFLFCDFVDVARDAWERMKAGEFPFRSAEIIPKRHRLTNVSLLGGRYPHFALPVMKFRAMIAGESCDVVRYTLRSVPMAEITDRNWDQNQNGGGDNSRGNGGGFGGGNNGGGGQGNGGGQMISPQACAQIAQMVAPIVAKMLAENQANAMGGPMANAGAYKDKDGKTFYRDDEGRAFTIDNGKIVYSADQDGGEKPKVKAGQGDVEQDLSDTPRTPHQDAGSVGGEKNAALSAEIKKYLAPFEQRINDLVAEKKSLEEKVGELARHNAAQGEAAKRTMLQAKCGEIAALGYAIGDKDKIERHVGRMMKMTADEVKEYLEDLKATAPKVKTSVERHGTSDGIRRPGSESDNERYYLENKEELDAMGLDKSVLELSDALGGV